MQSLNPADICFSISRNLLDARYLNEASQWDPATLAHGYPGLLCLFAELNHFYPSKEWEDAQDLCVRRLFDAIQKNGIYDSSLFLGTAGICFALDLASPPLLERIHSQFLSEIEQNYLAPLQETLGKKEGTPPRLYDLISGLCGFFPYLLRHASREDTLPLLKKMTAALVDLTHPLTIQGRQVPGWFIPSSFANEGETPFFGILDTGLAHGIAGVLTVLSKACIKNVQVPGLKKAIGTIVEWLQNMRRTIKSFERVWPSRFSLEKIPDGFREHSEYSYRDGWCYGAPGIAAALFIAAHALKDFSLYDYALAAMNDLCVRLQNQPTLKCPTMCHGYAGALAAVHQFYLATKDPFYREASERLAGQILAGYDPAAVFGFKSLAPQADGTEKNTDSPSLLGGSTGVVLSLLFAESTEPRPWLEMFLLG